MRVNRFGTLFLSLCCFFMLTGFFGAKGDTAAEERQNILKMRQDTLNELYKLAPGSKNEIIHAKGYAAFSNTGINLFVVSTANGFGLAHNNKTGKNVYMKMFSGGVGIGLGVKDFRGVFVFTTETALDEFVNSGWTAAAQADAAAKAGKEGDAIAAAIDVAPGIKLYQITKNGLALQATIQGTKYWKDEDLN